MNSSFELSLTTSSIVKRRTPFDEDEMGKNNSSWRGRENMSSTDLSEA